MQSPKPPLKQPKKKKKGFIRNLVTVVFGLILVGVSYEVYFYLFRSRGRMETLGRVHFLEECRKRNMNPADFAGPFLVDENDLDSGLVWRRKNGRDQIFVHVQYFPYRSESWLTRREEADPAN